MKHLLEGIVGEIVQRAGKLLLGVSPSVSSRGSKEHLMALPVDDADELLRTVWLPLRGNGGDCEAKATGDGDGAADDPGSRFPPRRRRRQRVEGE